MTTLSLPAAVYLEEDSTIAGISLPKHCETAACHYDKAEQELQEMVWTKHQIKRRNKLNFIQV